MAYSSDGYGDPYQDDPWYVDAIQWVGSLFSKCAKSDPATWQEHLITRCLNGKRWDGSPCPGTPDPRRAALAAQRDTQTAGGIASKLRAWNEGWGPTVAEMADPRNAILWTFAVAGGMDCYNSRDPQYPAQVWAWIEAQTPDWNGSTEPPPTLPPTGGEDPSESWWAQIITQAQGDGTDALQRVIQEAVRLGYSSLPEAARRALAAAGIDYYGGQAGDQLRASMPWIIGGGLVLAALSRRR